MSTFLFRSSHLRDQATGESASASRGNKTNGVRLHGDACSGAQGMLGVTRTERRREISLQPRSRFCCR